MRNLTDIELGCKWYFADVEATKGGDANSAIMDLFKHNKYESLVREAIQNSIDARQNGKPAKVSFCFRRISFEKYENFMELREHVKACIESYEEDAYKYIPMIELLDNAEKFKYLYYLTVADYNTTGMEYSKDIFAKEHNTFNAFVKDEGHNVKPDANTGGSYGYGKGAFFEVSPINTLIVSTMSVDGKVNFDGVTLLCTHKYKDVVCHKKGYYDSNEGEPVDEISKIPEPFRRLEPGTDINIMGAGMGNDVGDVNYRNEIYRQIYEAVLRNFWYAIINGKLEVEIGSPDKAQYLPYYNVNKDSIVSQVFERFQLSDKSIDLDKLSPAPYIEAFIRCNTDKDHILIEDKLPILGDVKFYAYKNANVKYSKVIYMRSLGMLVEAKKQGGSGFYGVFVCENAIGDGILRKLEDPTHSQWNPKIRNNIPGITPELAKNAISELKCFISNAIQKMFSADNAAELGVANLDNLLFTPSSFAEDIMGSDSIYGAPTGDEINKGVSVTTILEEGKVSTETSTRESIGSAIMPTITSAREDNKGNLGSGPSGTREKKPRPQKPPKPNIDILKKRNKEDEGGTKGTYVQFHNIKYRPFAGEIDGKLYHFVVIHSDKELLDCRIDVIIGNDMADEKLLILETTKGVADGNSIKNLNLTKGKNPKIGFRLADNVKHSIKIAVYEKK